jgi:hypothetical protein
LWWGLRRRCGKERFASGCEEHDLLGSVDADGHAALVDRPVMGPAQQDQVPEVRLSSIGPVFDVMGFGEP